jgi:hypothetical protein
MEIFNQSCRLPITYLTTIKKSLELFKYFLIVRCNPLLNIPALPHVHAGVTD